MNDFWETKKDSRSEPVNHKKLVNIDGIKIHRNIALPATPPPPPVQPKKSRHIRFNLNVKKIAFYSCLFIVLVLVGTFSLSSYYLASASKDKINVLKLLNNGKYLVIFQNNAEARPSGGFIGSFATVEISNFQIKNINFNTNIYKLDQAYAANHVVTPPAPYQIFTDQWALRDSNFAVSFPEAAQKIEWFYNQETGDNVSGVIAINGSVVRDLLAITGPIKLDNYNSTISYDNFFTALTTEIEQTYYQNPQNRDINEPKSILKDLLPVLLNKLIATNKIEMLKKVYSEISDKQILFYANEQNIEQSILAENWGGEVQYTPGDYLQINNANIGGNKSSLSVKEALDYSVTQGDDSLVGNLALTRSHSGTMTWPDGINTNYSRILVPRGSKMIYAELNGKDITKQISTGEEAGKTFFALTFITAPGTSDVLKLKYSLPIAENNYQLLVQKQSGNLGDNLVVKYKAQILYDGILNADKTLKAS